MATFIMLSNAASESGSGSIRPNVYQFHWIDELLGLSPGCKYDSNDTFDGQVWYAFAEILAGDHSQLLLLNLEPESWYSPSEIVNLDCDVVAEEYLKDQEPEWWAAMVKSRSEPTRGFWSGDFIFEAPGDAGAKEIGSPHLYSLTLEQEQFISDKAKVEIIQKLRQEFVSVTDAYTDEDGLIWARYKGKLVQLFLKADDEEEWEMYENFIMTDYIFDQQEFTYIER